MTGPGVNNAGSSELTRASGREDGRDEDAKGDDVDMINQEAYQSEEYEEIQRAEPFGAKETNERHQEHTEVFVSRSAIVDGIAGLEIVAASDRPAAASGIEEDGTDGEDEDDDFEDDDDDEDDDSVWGGGGLRGFLQKPEESWKISRQYFPSKAGGGPAWLDPKNLPKGEDMLCGICDKPLQFVLQVYAPAKDDAAAFHRTLFVFICPSLACLQQHELQQHRQPSRRSVKVFRSQLPRANPFYSYDAPSENGLEVPVSEGAPLCSWCRTWKGHKVCGGCRQTRYCSPSHQLQHWRSDHAPHCRQVQEQAKKGLSDTSDRAESEATAVSASASASASSSPRVAAAPGPKSSCQLWPEFELIDEEVDLAPSVRSRDGKLLADYEKRKGQGREFSAQEVEDVEESSAEEQHWAFFQAKVSEAPKQVLWYLRSPDAKPLWPRLKGQPQKTNVSPCSLCGGERTFEFQILPQLLYFFGVKDTPDSLDWGTIAVYSCARSCKIEGYCEEFAWVQPLS